MENTNECKHGNNNFAILQKTVKGEFLCPECNKKFKLVEVQNHDDKQVKTSIKGVSFYFTEGMCHTVIPQELSGVYHHLSKFLDHSPPTDVDNVSGIFNPSGKIFIETRSIKHVYNNNGISIFVEDLGYSNENSIGKTFISSIKVNVREKDSEVDIELNNLRVYPKRFVGIVEDPVLLHSIDKQKVTFKSHTAIMLARDTFDNPMDLIMKCINIINACFM